MRTSLIALAVLAALGLPLAAFAQDPNGRDQPQQGSPQPSSPAPGMGQGMMPGMGMGQGGMGMGQGQGMMNMDMMQGMMRGMGQGMMQGMAEAQPKGDTGPSSQAYNGVMMRMHKDMAITYTGDADIDFMKGMLPHHQAAIDMAKIELAFGKDQDARKLAEEIVRAQEAEVALIQDWLKKHGR